MKKLFFITIFLAVLSFSCNKKNPTVIIENTTHIEYGISADDVNKIFSKGGYKKTNLSYDEIIEKLNDVDIFKSALENFPHRTTVHTYKTEFAGVSLPIIAFFDQDELFAQFLPFTPISRDKFDDFLAMAHETLGESMDEVSDEFLQYYWPLNDSNSVFQIAYSTVDATMIMLFINYDIRMENDIAIFNAVEPSQRWFLSGNLGDSYTTIESKEKNLYATAANQDNLMYMSKIDEGDTPIFYIYFFDNEAKVETILFQNIEGREIVLADMFSKHFRVEPQINSEAFSENFNRTSYIWDLGDDTGAFIIMESLMMDGVMVQQQASAFITRNFQEMKQQMQ